MVRIVLVGLTVCALAPRTHAQAQQNNSTQSPPLLNPLLTTGVPIGTPMLKPIGSQFQQVGQQPGSNIGTGQPTWRQDPLPPGGKVIDLKNSVAPVPASSLPPALRSQEPTSLWDQIYAKWAAGLGIAKPDQAKTGYVPGMTRRAKERKGRKWIWD